MSLTVSRKKQFEPVPEGVYEAVCVGIYDLGTQHNEMFKNDTHQVLLTFELPDIRLNGNSPMVISKKYTLSLHKKANLTNDLVGWRGRAFTEDELEKFDLKTMLGTGCLIQVIHQSNNDKTYAKIISIMPLPDGTEIEPENDLKFFTFSDFTEIPEEPEWIRKLIESSKEFQEVKIIDDNTIDD